MDPVMPMLEALVFDFDGIIVNSEPVHYRAYQVILEPHGLGFSWEEYQDHYMGLDDRDAYRRLFERMGRPVVPEEIRGLVEAKARVFEELAVGATPFPGVVELAQSARRWVKVALCSGARRSDIEPVVRRLGLLEHFASLVSADDVARSKPDPTCYRMTLQRLAVSEPTCAVAIEDTPAGIAAARGAGLRVIAVTNSHSASSLLAADACIDTLEDLSLADVADLVGLQSPG